MADQYGQRQLSTGSVEGRPAPTGAEKESADQRFSRAETARLQAEAQARINETRHDTIGNAP